MCIYIYTRLMYKTLLQGVFFLNVLLHGLLFGVYFWEARKLERFEAGM